MTTVDNNQDILDSRDVIARRDELKEEREALAEALADAAGLLSANDLRAWDADNAEELAALETFIAGGSDEWEHGETLVRETYFEDYARELADDTGAIDPRASWPLNCIDWEHAARELQYDYTGADFAGVTYWFRS